MGNYKTDIKSGLSNVEVQNRIDNNEINYDTVVPTKSVMKIIHSNVFTLFNILNFALALAVLLVGSYKNVMFLGVVFCNTLIGIIQEINAKRIIDKLSLISATKTKVIRNNELVNIPLNQIVVDDLIVLNSGNQVVCDSIVLEGCCEVDESLITGESDSI